MSNFLTYLFNCIFRKGFHGPRGFTAADLKQKVLDDLCPTCGVGHFRVELDAKKLFSRMGGGSHFGIGRGSSDGKSFWKGLDGVPWLIQVTVSFSIPEKVLLHIWILGTRIHIPFFLPV
jgi:hypothetical protein